MLENKVPPPVYALITFILIFLIDLFLPLDILPPGLKYSLVAISTCFGVALLLDSLLRFIRSKTTVNPLKPESASKLVVKGVFRLSRNPMYLGMLMLILAFTLFTGNPLGLLPAAAFVLVINHAQILPEERALEKLFGDDYLKYKTSVRRWI